MSPRGSALLVVLGVLLGLAAVTVGLVLVQQARRPLPAAPPPPPTSRSTEGVPAPGPAVAAVTTLAVHGLLPQRAA